MRGSGSPTSMSTMRVPPNAVTQHDDARRLGADLADRAPRRAPSGMGAQRGERGVGFVGGDDRDELALVGDVERVDAEQLARAGHRRPDRQARPRRARR